MMWSFFFALSSLGSRGACNVSGRRRAGMFLSQRRCRLGMKSLVETVHGGRGKGADDATPVPWFEQRKAISGKSENERRMPRL